MSLATKVLRKAARELYENHQEWYAENKAAGNSVGREPSLYEVPRDFVDLEVGHLIITFNAYLLFYKRHGEEAAIKVLYNHVMEKGGYIPFDEHDRSVDK